MLFPLPLLHRAGPRTALTKVLFFFLLRMGASRMGTLSSSTAVSGGTHPSPAVVPRTPGPCPWPLPGPSTVGQLCLPSVVSQGLGSTQEQVPVSAITPAVQCQGLPVRWGFPGLERVTASPEVRHQCHPGCPCSPLLPSGALSGLV